MPLHICFNPPYLPFLFTLLSCVGIVWGFAVSSLWQINAVSPGDTSVCLFFSKRSWTVKLTTHKTLRLCPAAYSRLSVFLYGCPPPNPQMSENQYQIAWGPLFGVGLTPRCPPTLLLSLHVAQYLTSILIPRLISFDKLWVSLYLPLSPFLFSSLLHSHSHTHTANTHGYFAFLPFEGTLWSGSNKKANPNTRTEALSDSWARIIALFALQIFKNYNEIRFAPQIINENTGDILCCRKLMVLCGWPVSETTPTLT